MQHVRDAVGIKQLLRILRAPNIADPNEEPAARAAPEPALVMQSDCGRDQDARHRQPRRVLSRITGFFRNPNIDPRS